MKPQHKDRKEQVLEPTVKTERQKYVEKLETELSKSAKSKHFIESQEGQYVINLVKELISDLINNITNHRCEQSDYIEKRGQITVLRKFVAVLEGQGNEDRIKQLRDQLDLANSEE